MNTIITERVLFNAINGINGTLNVKTNILNCNLHDDEQPSTFINYSRSEYLYSNQSVGLPPYPEAAQCFYRHLIEIFYNGFCNAKAGQI